MSISIQKSLTQLKELSGLDHIGFHHIDGRPQYSDSEPWMEHPDSEPWMEHPDVRQVKHLQKKAEKARNSALVEYKNALYDFKSTHEKQALAEYNDLKRNFPSHDEYVQILEKLQEIFALPDMLDSYIKTPTVKIAQDITDSCTTILRMHEQKHYDPLFKTHKYLDLQGREKQPKYGKWTYKAKEYELEKVITNVKNIMKWFIQKLS